MPNAIRANPKPILSLLSSTYPLFFLEIILKIFHNGICLYLNILFFKKIQSILLLRTQGGLMDPKLVKQFIIFLVILFGWTIVALLIGYK